MNSITLNVDVNEIYKLKEFINQIIQKTDFKTDLISEEVFVNIVSYSNCTFICVNAEYEKPALTIEFIDDGIEFNPLLKEEPEFPDDIDDAKEGGLGIYLTREIADEIYYEYKEKRNHLKIIIKVEE